MRTPYAVWQYVIRFLSNKLIRILTCLNSKAGSLYINIHTHPLSLTHTHTYVYIYTYTRIHTYYYTFYIRLYSFFNVICTLANVPRSVAKKLFVFHKQRLNLYIYIYNVLCVRFDKVYITVFEHRLLPILKDNNSNVSVFHNHSS